MVTQLLGHQSGSTVVILGRLARRTPLRRIIAQFPTCLSMPVIENERGQETPRGQEGQGQRGSQAGPRRGPRQEPREARQDKESRESQEEGGQEGKEAKKGEARESQEGGQGGINQAF